MARRLGAYVDRVLNRRLARYVASAALMPVVAGACADDSNAADQWCEDFVHLIGAPDDEFEARQARLIRDAPEEIEDVVAYSLAVEDALPLPEGVSGDEADARLDAYVEDNCRSVIDEVLDE